MPRHVDQGKMPQAMRRKISKTKAKAFKELWASRNEDQRCIVCNRIFPRPRNVNWNVYRKRRFCSYRCHNAFRDQREALTCPHCGKAFKTKKAYAAHGIFIRFCSRACRIASGEGGSGLSGKDHPQWKGGKSRDNHRRETPEYKAWRRAVYVRDRWTCQMCHRKQKRPVAHHIKTWEDYPALRFEVSNGQTLCRSCHKKVHASIGETTRFVSSNK